MKHLFHILCFVLPAAQAFVALQPSALRLPHVKTCANSPIRRPSVALRMVNKDDEKENKAFYYLDQIKQNQPDWNELKNKLNVDRLVNSSNQIRENMMAGEWGTRGEIYVIGQFALLLCVALGTIPFVGDIVLFLAGPGLFFVGLITSLLAVQDLGPALSPWPVAASKSPGLTTDGLYGQVRHPIYAGLLALAFGFSVWTGSATRLVLTGLLYWLLDVKSEVEEKDLAETFPDYPAYKEKVTGKFIPRSFLEDLQQKKKSID